MIRSGIRVRLVAAFMTLALLVGVGTALAGFFASERIGAYLIEWHVSPIMDMLIEAEERAWRAEDDGRRPLYYGSDLAAGLRLHFYVGKQLKADWAELPDGIHFQDRGSGFLLLRTGEHIRYALAGGTGQRMALRSSMIRTLLLCIGVGLVAATLIAFVLSHRLSAPLVGLTRAVRQRGMPAGDNRTLPPLPQYKHPYEVHVLAEAIAAHEQALCDYARRESCFTGDVSHELRTPLTVLQGGLEILDLHVTRHPEAASLRPLVERMSRTVTDMSATVRALLLLARNPEYMELEQVDMHAQLQEAARRPGMELSCDGPPPAPLHTQRELAAAVVRNLVENALHYSEDGHARIRLHAGGFDVINRGQIPADVDIFERGVRAARPDSRGVTPAGSGLGLSLVLRICTRLGWRITCTTDATTTTFCVLFSPADSNAPAPEPAA